MSANAPLRDTQNQMSSESTKVKLKLMPPALANSDICSVISSNASSGKSCCSGWIWEIIFSGDANSAYNDTATFSAGKIESIINNATPAAISEISCWLTLFTTRFDISHQPRHEISHG